jgi:ubiquinone/menaquinone biosynthesis C-methylase UbiE
MNTARTYWDQNAKHYDRSMRVFGGPIPPMLDRVAREVAGARDVLELAAGTGIVTEVLARSADHVLATDYSSAMLAVLERKIRAERLANVTVAQADIAALDFADGRFDAVVAANVLHLVPDLGAALRSMARVVRPGGVLVVPTYCHAETAVARMASRALALTRFPGRRRLTLEELTRAVRDAGLTVTTRELLPGLLPIGFVSARR